MIKTEAMKTKAMNVTKALFALVISGACVCGLVALNGCTSSEEEESAPDAMTKDTGLTGGVAATVNGVEIPEDKVTNYINNMRINNQMEEDDEWKKYLEMYGYTPKSIRDQVLEQLIDQELVKQFADRRGVTTDDAEIQSYVDKMRENYSSDEAWQTALEGAGFDDEQAYRDALQYSILQKKLQDGFESAAETNMTDATLLEKAKDSISTYDNAKKSSHILMAGDNEEAAQEVLDRIKSGELPFEEAVAQYSTDEASKANAGNVGWSKVNEFVDEYEDALNDLSKGEMSDLVKSQYGYHIILVTDEFIAPDNLTNLNQIPSDILAEVRTDAIESVRDDDMDAWLDEMEEGSDVVINDMPDNVPYNINMSDAYSKEEEKEIDEEADEQLVEDVAAEEEDLLAADELTDEAEQSEQTDEQSSDGQQSDGQ